MCKPLNQPPFVQDLLLKNHPFELSDGYHLEVHDHLQHLNLQNRDMKIYDIHVKILFVTVQLQSNKISLKKTISIFLCELSTKKLSTEWNWWVTFYAELSLWINSILKFVLDQSQIENLIICEPEQESDNMIGQIGY